MTLRGRGCRRGRDRLYVARRLLFYAVASCLGIRRGFRCPSGWTCCAGFRSRVSSAAAKSMTRRTG